MPWRSLSKTEAEYRGRVGDFWSTDSTDTANEARKNSGVFNAATGALDLTGASTCATWQATNATAPGAVNCFSIQRAEQRWGNGDGIYTTAEQQRASRAHYDVIRGSIANFLDLPRRARIGLEINF